MISTGKRASILSLCLLKGSLVFLDLLSVAGKEQLFALLSTLGDSKAIGHGLRLTFLEFLSSCSRLDRLGLRGLSFGSRGRSDCLWGLWLRLIPAFLDELDNSRNSNTFSHVSLLRGRRSHQHSDAVGLEEN